MAAIVEFLVFLASSEFLKVLLTRALVVLGISTITYAGSAVVLSAVESSISANWSGLPASTLAVLTMAKLDQFLNLIWSAYAGALAAKGLTAAGGLQRVVWKPSST